MSDLQPPPGFVETPHPAIDGPEGRVAHVESIVIDRPLAEVIATVDATPLSVRHPAAGGLPGVAGTLPLTADGFGPVGGRHLVFLTDGTTVIEQVIENGKTDADWRFRYVVWGYTTPAAAPLRYGLGDFHYVAEGEGKTRCVWNYSFGLTEQTIFPEIDADRVKRTQGMDICCVTSAKTNDEGRELLKLLGLPFSS